MVVETAYLIMPSQTNIVTIGFKLTTIRTGSSSAQNTGMQTRNQHIIVFLFKDLERTRKAIVEESEVNTQVIVVNTFPSTHSAHQSGRFHIGSSMNFSSVIRHPADAPQKKFQRFLGKNFEEPS